ncbi:MAG: alpha-2-macroglobulin [Betaproteobacteria bacterium]
MKLVTSIRDLAIRAGRAFARLSGRALTPIFGNVAWAAPPWARWSGARIGAGSKWTAANPARAGILALLLVAITAGGIYGYKWWQARPKPVEVKLTVENPPRTPIENEDEKDRDPRPLLVHFAQSVAPLALVGKEIPSGIRITPPIEGKWKWTDDKELEFQPKEDWPVGSEHQIEFDRNAVAPQIVLQNYTPKFKTPAFIAKVSRSQFYQDPTNPTLKKAVFDINFSQPVNAAELEKRIELKLAGQTEGVWGVGRERTKFTVSYDKLKLNAFVHSENLSTPQEDSSIELKVDSGVAAVRGGKPFDSAITRVVRVPGLASLAVKQVGVTVAMTAKSEPEQVVTVTLSASTLEKDIKSATTAWLLPVYNPKTKKEDRIEPYAWGDPKEISEELLAVSTKVELELVAGEREHSENHVFKYNAPIGRYLYVQVERGMKSFGGYTLAKRVQQLVQVPPFPAQLNILGQGALLAMSGEKKIAIMVRDLPGVKMDVGRVLPAQLQHLVTQSEGNFDKPQFVGSFGMDNLAERFEKKIPLPRLKQGKAHYEALNLGEYLKKDGADKRGIFLLRVQGYDPRLDRKRARKDDEEPAEPDEGEGEGNQGQQDQAEPSEREDFRLLLVTDLGILVKRSLDGSQDVYIQSIASGLPVSGAEVEVIGKNGLTLFSQTTDANGRAQFAKLENLSRERTPLMYLVKKAGDMSFLPLNRRDRGLDFSRFDVGGIRNTLQPGTLSAYLFSDRGIYRPGDTINIGMIVKAANWAKAVAGLPLEVEVTDPRGLSVKREKIKLGAGGFNELNHTTQETSPTGNYTVNLYTVKDGQANTQLGSVTVRVQEFLPDRMKVVAKLSAEVTEGWVSPAELKGKVNVQNLFGTPATNRRVEATLTLQPAYPAFRSFPDYRFYDPLRAKEGYSDKLNDGTTDDEGNAEFALGLERYARATYRLHFLARAFEPEGGRSVAADTAMLVSELPWLVGFKPDGDMAYVSRGSKRIVNVIAIDPKAKKIAVGDLKLELIERRFVSVLLKQANGTYKYESRPKEIPVKESVLSIPAGGFNLPLDTATPGTFFYRIRNADGVEQNRIEFTVVGAGNVTRSLDRNAELQLTLKNKDVSAGDDIEVSIRAPYAGAGLITIERDKVYAQQWFKSTTQASVQKIKLPADFEGNGYVTVQFIRDPGSDEIFMSPLSYGTVPFSVNLSKRTNKLSFNAPAKVKPGEVLKIKLSAEQPTRAVVFAVDEGILQVARYQEANPLAHFFQKRSLDVRTSQILDLILPEFRKLMQAAAPGGDAEGALGKNLNPFKRKRDKPAVYWSGIVDVNGEQEFSYTVPETFNGTMRLMAVSVSEQAIGTLSGKTIVQGDFVLSPNAPLAVAPGDEFEVSVGVANNVAGSGKDAQIAVSLKVSPHLEVIGGETQSLKIAEKKEGVAIYRLKAKSGAVVKLGSATMTFGATLNGQPEKSAKLSTDVSVRPAGPYYTQVTVGSFTGSQEVAVKRDVFAEYRKGEAAVSPLPLVIANGLMAYLDSFPHLCSEQITSRAFPSVVLGQRPEFGNASQKDGVAKAQQAFNSALAVLRSRQNAEGGFGLWTASVEADEYVSVYAIHMMIEARERGYAVPPDMIAKANSWLQQVAASPAKDLNDVRTRAYATYLLTRQGTVTSTYLAALRETLDKKYPAAWQKDSIAVFLAGSYKLMKDEKQAGKLMDEPLAQLEKRGEPYRYEHYYDPTIRDAQTLYIASRHFPDRAKKLDFATMGSMMKTIQDSRFNTHSAAYVILALDAYATQIEGKIAGKISIAEIGKDGKSQALALPQNLIPRVPFSMGTAKLKFGNEMNMTSYYAVAESGFDKAPPMTELKSGMEIIREYIDAEGKPITSVKVGQELTVRLKFRSIGRDFIPNIALVDLLPGGFEPVLNPIDAPNVQPAKKGAFVNRLGNIGGWNVEYADVREERVVLYGTVGANVSEYRYRIRATNVGTFIVPPAYGESMYERDVQARSMPGKIVVERVGK